LGHDNHRRLSKLYWEEKKGKTLRGVETVETTKSRRPMIPLH